MLALIIIALVLTLLVVILSMVISSLRKKIKKLEETVDFLQKQKETHIELERRRNEKLDEVRNDDGTVDIDATNKLMQELSKRRSK